MNHQIQIQNNRPLHPDQLFNRIMRINFKDLQCQCQSQKLKKQKNVLFKLLQQYTNQIQKLKREDIQRQRLKHIRAQLQLQSQHLHREKREIQLYIKRDVDQLKVLPIEIAQKQHWQIQISLLKQSSHKKNIKIQQLTQYVQKLQIINRKLEQQRRLIRIYNDQNRNTNLDIQLRFRQQLKRLRIQQTNYTNQIRLKMREQQQRSRQTAEQVQFQIAQRNRKRYQEFQFNQRKNQMMNRAHEISVMEMEQNRSQMINCSPPTLRVSRWSPSHYNYYPRII